MAVTLSYYGRISNINENRVSWMLLRAVENAPGEKQKLKTKTVQFTYK